MALFDANLLSARSRALARLTATAAARRAPHGSMRAASRIRSTGSASSLTSATVGCWPRPSSQRRKPRSSTRT